MILDIVEILDFVTANENAAFFYTPLIKGNELSYLFKKNSKSVSCMNVETITESLSVIEKLSKEYEFAYGSISYETGYLFEERLNQLLNKEEEKYISFHFFKADEVEIIPTKEILFKNIHKILIPNNFNISNLELNESQTEHEEKIRKIKKYISEGDTYQVNYTLKSKFNSKGEVSSFIAQLLFNQSASYTSIINERDDFIISISPELFFKTEGNKIISKPMKGTIKRGKNIDDDFSKGEQLKNSKKDKAENIMIVDLLRNDIGKLSKFNSVEAKPLFEIEKYETLYQMTSTVSGELNDKSFAKIITNLFPCGSITGAPKIRTMEIINELEKEKRGIYTGTIGIIKNKDFTFNIPIRTITLNKFIKKGELGLGSGIVWDSDPKSEFEEVKLKSKFLTSSKNYFELIETMLIEDGDVYLLENHINRLKKSAEYFLFKFDEIKLRELIYLILTGLINKNKFKLRLLLTKWGEVKYNLEQILPSEPMGRIVISDERIDSNNKFVYFKTTNRTLYNNEIAKCSKEGFDDVIFQNEKGEITEGARTNIIISKGGKLFTPPTSAGLLNGCQRGYILSSDKNLSEKTLFVDDIINADKVYLINSVRKEIIIKELSYKGRLYIIS
jgi:para-aminobenzoate synthetase / 4-amino-4-deoxychorismate lyase